MEMKEHLPGQPVHLHGLCVLPTDPGPQIPVSSRFGLDGMSPALSHLRSSRLDHSPGGKLPSPGGCIHLAQMTGEKTSNMRREVS